MTYPSWSYYPRNVRAPEWVTELAAVTATAQASIDTTEPQAAGEVVDTTSDAVLAHLREGFEGLGYQVESGKKQFEKITRPVLYGDDGQPEVSYDIDAFHDAMGIAVEVEAGRGAMNGADYRNIVRTSLLLDARYLAMFIPLNYRYKQNGKVQTKTAYASTRRQLDAIYASRRLQLPFEGVLLIGY